jgi:hypothetical protein
VTAEKPTSQLTSLKIAFKSVLKGKFRANDAKYQ